MSQKILRKVNKQLKWVGKSILINCEVNSQLNESENSKKWFKWAGKKLNKIKN